MIGRVVSVKMQKTVAVLVESRKTHPLYKKSYKFSKRYLVDDLIGVKLGDILEMEKIRPVSKNKHWRVLKVVGRNIEEIVEEKLKEEAARVIGKVMPASPAGGPEEKEEAKESKGLKESEVKETEEKKTMSKRKEKSGGSA